jgi:hypothetical protein
MSKKDDASVSIIPDDAERRHPYCMIENEIIHDERLSPECRWLIMYLSIFPKGYEISVRVLHQKVEKHISKKRLIKLISEACKFGYLEYVSKVKV